MHSLLGPSDLSRQVDIGGGSSASGSGGSISISVSSGDGVGGAFSVTAGESAAASGGSALVVAGSSSTSIGGGLTLTAGDGPLHLARRVTVGSGDGVRGAFSLTAGESSAESGGSASAVARSSSTSIGGGLTLTAGGGSTSGGSVIIDILDEDVCCCKMEDYSNLLLRIPGTCLIPPQWDRRSHSQDAVSICALRWSQVPIPKFKNMNPLEAVHLHRVRIGLSDIAPKRCIKQQLIADIGTIECSIHNNSPQLESFTGSI